MGILSPLASEQKTPLSVKRKSGTLDFSTLKPLNSTGTKNFAGYRDPSATSPTKKSGKRKDDDAMDSDADDEDDSKGADEADEADIKTESKGMLSPEDALRQGELAEGMRKIKVRIISWPLRWFRS